MLTRVGLILFCDTGMRKYVTKVAHTMRNASSAYCIDGIEAHSTAISPFRERGVETQAEKRNIHFMNVTAEYLEINGLNMPRYIEKLRLFRIIMNIPKGVLSVTPPGAATLLTIRYMIPAKLIATPPAFCHVTGSLITSAAIPIV